MLDFTGMTRRQVHAAMCEADRQRGRIAYRGLTELEDRLEAQGVKQWHKKYEERWSALIRRNEQTPEYAAANADFTAASRRLLEMDGDSRVRDRDGRLINVMRAGR
jgi:hypothetical protein